MPDEIDSSEDATGWGGLRLWGGIGFAVVLVALAGGYWFVVPRLADSMLQQRLDAFEARTPFEAEYGRLQTSALDGAELNDIRIETSARDKPLVTIERVQTDLDLVALLSGRPVISSIRIEGLDLHVRRRSADFSTLERLARRLRGKLVGGSTANTGDRSSQSDGDSTSSGRGLLRYTGGEWPDATIRDATVHFDAIEGAPGWPVRTVTWKRVSLDSSGQSATLRGEARIERGETHPRWSVPSTIELEGTVRLPLGESTGQLDFDRPLEVVGLPGVPFLRGGIRSVHVADDRVLSLHGLSLALQGGGEPASLASLDQIEVDFSSWPRGFGGLELEAVSLTQPTVSVELDGRGGSNWHECRHLLRGPIARRVASRARRLAEHAASDDSQDGAASDSTDDGSASDPSDTGASRKTTSLSARLFGELQRFLNDPALPDTVEVKGARLDVKDPRSLDLVRSASTWSLRKGAWRLEQNEMKGRVSMEGSFRARADGEKRGRASARIAWHYRSGDIEWSLEADALDLAWLARVGGPRAAGIVHGGELKADLQSRPVDGETRQTFSGFVGLDGGELSIPRLAESTISDLDTSYHFEGYYAPDAAIPEPTLIKSGDLPPSETLPSEQPAEPAAERKDRESTDANEDKSSEEGEDIPDRGAFVVTKGRAAMNGVELDVQPAAYGLDGLARLPARFDLTLSLPKTPVQSLFDAVPKAIRGPLNRTRMKGAFAWDLDLELPLHNADETEWNSSPKLTNFELLELPEAVDVRKLKKGFEHTIEIDAENFHVRRHVQIPPMRPTPASWLKKNGEMKLETIDERRRKREWPTRPEVADIDPNEHVPEEYERPDALDDASRRVWLKDFVDSPKIWLSDVLEDRYADKPWRDEQPLASLDKVEIPDDRRPVPYVRELIRRQKRGESVPLEMPGDVEDGAGDAGGAEAAATGGAANQEGRYLTDVRDSSRKQADDMAASDEETSRFRPLNESMILEYGEKDRKRPRAHPYGPYVYVPIHHIARWMPRAILTTEDNSFFEHHGFNWFAVKDSLEDNLDAGGFVRGASTVSMQLIKNLFLSFDKVLARKFREVFLVWLMEDVVDIPKSRIMELYLNIIEFGPGIFGIHDAAVHYFGKRPDQLELIEVAWLTSIIPDPREYHRYYEHGEISDYWFEGMKHYIDVMHERGRVTRKQREQAKREKPSFYKPDRGEPKLRIYSEEQRNEARREESMEEISDILE